ncbi:MAG: 5-formyltetrahydrofolate cyclo-ligase [Agriterribacter sp.]
MTKKDTRILYKQKRTELKDNEIEKLQDLVLIRFQKLSLPFIEYLHTYLPVHNNKEVDTFPVIDFMEFCNPGLQVVIPKTDMHTNSMTSYLYNDNTVLHKNRYGIMEPDGGEIIDAGLIDMILVPLLAFDENGSRVGYGKGYYDRFLLQCREDVIKIGLSFFDAADPIDDTDEFDIPLTYCVTPYRIYEF